MYEYQIQTPCKYAQRVISNRLLIKFQDDYIVRTFVHAEEMREFEKQACEVCALALKAAHNVGLPNPPLFVTIGFNVENSEDWS